MLNIYKTKSMKKFNDEDKEHNPNFKNHEIHLFKHHLLVGGTGLGKTNCVINMILAMSGCFGNIQVFTADPNEKLYRMLKEKLQDQIIIENIEDIPSYREQKKNGQQLLIIDDFIEQPKSILTKLEEYATQSRKKLFTCVFLTQSYYSCPKKIRMQIRYLTLLKLCDKRNFGLIISSLDTDIESEVIKKVIKNATKEELNTCMIDLQARDMNKLIRRNFGLNYYILENEDGTNISNPQLFQGSGLIN